MAGGVMTIKQSRHEGSEGEVSQRNNRIPG